MSDLEIVAVLRARPGSEQAVHEILTGLVAPSRAEDGCLEYGIYVSPTDPATFIAVEKWRSQPDLEAHRASTHLRTAFTRAGPHFGAVPELLTPLA